MSLINEALKKAQKQRTGETPSLTAMPSVGGESAARIARRGKPAGFNALVTSIVIGVVALAAIIAGTVIFLNRKPAPPPAANPVAVAPTHATAPAAIAPAPVAVAPVPKPVETTPAVSSPAATPLVVPNFTAPAATHPSTSIPTSNSAPVSEPPKPVTVASAPPPLTPAPATASAPVPITVTPAPAAATPASGPRKLEPRAINYIESIRVAGIRASGSDRKVLMNDRVYRIGDLVEAEMGLKLAGITTNSLTFEDENGGRYTRNF